MTLSIKSVIKIVNIFKSFSIIFALLLEHKLLIYNTMIYIYIYMYVYVYHSRIRRVNLKTVKEGFICSMLTGIFRIFICIT
jgi:hypothetical protein